MTIEDKLIEHSLTGELKTLSEWIDEYDERPYEEMNQSWETWSQALIELKIPGEQS